MRKSLSKSKCEDSDSLTLLLNNVPKLNTLYVLVFYIALLIPFAICLKVGPPASADQEF